MDKGIFLIMLPAFQTANSSPYLIPTSVSISGPSVCAHSAVQDHSNKADNNNNFMFMHKLFLDILQQQFCYNQSVSFMNLCKDFNLSFFSSDT